MPNGQESAPRPASGKQHAVVFSGNGYNAAYEAGVLKAILHGVAGSTRGEAIQPDIYAGTSVGAYNAAFMVSESELGDLAAVEKLEHSWTVGVVPRFRANPFDYLDPKFYLPNPLTPFVNLGRDALYVSRDLVKRAGDFFASASLTRPLAAFQEQILGYEWDILADIEPMVRQIRNSINLEKIRGSGKKLLITAANWKKGTTRTFENKDFAGDNGYQVITAAMAIPGAVPRQRIDQEDFVDGAMLMERPLQPVIDARDRTLDRQVPHARLTLHVIYLDPEFGQGPLMDVRGSFSVVYRLFLLAFSRSVNAEIERIERTNRALKFLDLLRDFDPESEVMRLWSRLNQETADSIEVEVHRYRSSQHLADLMDIFRVSDEKLKHLIDRGYTDAVRHDCREAGCVLLSQE